MQSRNGESSPPGSVPGGDAAHADPPQEQQVNGLLPGPRTGQPGQPGQPPLPEPPDRPRARPSGPPPPVPAKLPKRTVPPDGSRPSVPSKLYPRPVPPSGPKSPAPSGQPGQPGEPPGRPGERAPSWGVVLATTVRLSVQRRLGWVRRVLSRRPGRSRGPGSPSRYT